jgi:S1-C subfamily serine protease
MKWRLLIVGVALVVALPVATVSGAGLALRGVVAISVTVEGQPVGWSASGIVLTGSGEVLTTNDVIRDAASITVSDGDSGRAYSATVIGYDETADIAVLKLRGAFGLPTAPLGNSALAKAGEAVTAYGSLGLRGGPLLAAHGEILLPQQGFVEENMDGSLGLELPGLLSNDAPALPESVGGPLVDAGGNVIGVNVLGRASYGATPIGLEGAIPIDRARSIAERISNGKASLAIHVGPTAMLGMTLEPGDLYEGLTTGVTVLTVIPGSPLDKAGLAPGDIIESFAGKSVTAPSELTNLLLTSKPGRRVELVWVGVAGGVHEANVRLAVGPPQ